MMSTGASASFGTALNVTRYGSRMFAYVFDHQVERPIAAPSNTPTTKPMIVALNVNSMSGTSVPVVHAR
jgi:hypothetical protein